MVPCGQYLNVSFNFGGKNYPIHPLDLVENLFRRCCIDLYVSQILHIRYSCLLSSLKVPTDYICLQYEINILFWIAAIE